MAKFAECSFSVLRPSFFDGTAPAQNRAHRSDGQCYRIRLRHLLYATTTSSTPMPRTRLWDRVYCCPTAAKPLVSALRVLAFLRDLQEKKRADERTRTADLISLRVN